MMMRKGILILFLIGFTIIKAQKDVVQFLQLTEFSNEMMESYLKPLTKMNTGNVNAGWYHSAKTHRFLGFDVSLAMSSTSMNDVTKGFFVTDLPNFDEYYIVETGSSPITPNVAGETSDLPTVKRIGSGDDVELPNGNGLESISIPIISAGIGLPYNTELRIKYLPKIDRGDIGETMLYGVSLKHSVKEYINGFKDIPELTLSLMGGVSVMRNDIEVDYLAITDGQQMLVGETIGYTGRILAGIDLQVFSAYMGVGYGASVINYGLEGYYLVGDVSDEVEEYNPVSVSYDYSQVEVNIGISAKIAFVDLFADYTFGNYATLNIGVGYNFR